MLSSPIIHSARQWLAARPQVQFLLLAAGFYALWVLIYEQGLEPAGNLDDALSANLAVAAAGLLKLVGVAAGTDPAAPTTVTMFGQAAVYVGNPCNGLVLYALFAGFVLAYPGSGRRRLWFIPLGLAVIYGINVLRIAALAINHTYWYHTVEFNHHYTFTFVAYGAILVLWHQWVRPQVALTAVAHG
ncbi:exosortase X [Hymenobacter rubripertinctus]|uniref:Exosortase/archaeosortase family protein n=1 Tax=Hymenobacter rubripertinctus TaxID=2029981 RepID=A0A418R501_9BACT|nr:archaeosortase/exosortase family protein [Hymenobacter rubripertinctus]RIY12421.1 hypothetical protein D0T11_05265 [Hymenobacter rubripertinctus]